MRKWYIKRRPTGVSSFRDLFPYYAESFVVGGSVWAATRSEAYAFDCKHKAFEYLRAIRSEDPDTVVVKVKGK